MLNIDDDWAAAAITGQKHSGICDKWEDYCIIDVFNGVLVTIRAGNCDREQGFEVDEATLP